MFGEHELCLETYARYPNTVVGDCAGTTGNIHTVTHRTTGGQLWIVVADEVRVAQVRQIIADKVPALGIVDESIVVIVKPVNDFQWVGVDVGSQVFMNKVAPESTMAMTIDSSPCVSFQASKALILAR